MSSKSTGVVYHDRSIPYVLANPTIFGIDEHLV